MKKRVIKTWPIAIVLMLLSMHAFASNIETNRPIVISYFENYPPLSWKENGEMKGIMIDILDEVLIKRMGKKTQHLGHPWARAQRLVKIGQADAFCTLATKERQKYSIPTKEYVIANKQTVFTYHGNPRLKEIKKIKSIKDLKNFTTVDYIGSGWAKENSKNLNIFWASDSSQIFGMLASKRADLLIDIDNYVYYMINKLNLKSRIIATPVVLDTIYFHLSFSKKSKYKSLSNEFDKHLRAIKKDGTYQAIIDRYRK